MNKFLRPSVLSSTTWIAVAIFSFTLFIFVKSRVHQVTDSNYSMLVSQSLLEHGSFKLDNYSLPRLEPFDRGYYVSNGAIYQLELANNHIFYHLPPGSSILSTPYVAVMRLFGVRPTNPDRTYNRNGEVKIEASLAALLMAALAVIFFYTAHLALPRGWSAIIALGAALGTQVWSTASRALWTDTWGLVLIGVAVLMLLAHELGTRSLNPYWMATVLAWTYFVRPTNALPIMAVSIYLLIYHRKLFLAYALTGAAWFAGFLLYSWHNYGEWLPTYYRSNRLNFSFFWTALAGNLVSPARGLLVYVPVIFFVAYLVVRHWTDIRFTRLVALSLAISVAHMVAISGFPHWWGGHSFGARFTTGLVPWLVLLAILGVDALMTWRRKRQELAQPARLKPQLITGGALLVLSMFINARGAMSHKTWLWNATPIGVDEHPAKLWYWREPQFLAGWVPSPFPRDYPPIVGQLDFSTAESEKYLWYGWADREAQFRWTNGKEATLVFGSDALTDVQLTMRLSPYLPKPGLSEQRVTLTLNGRMIETLVLKGDQADEYKVPLTKDLLRERNLLIFGLPDATSPESVGSSGDRRELGIAMYWIRLER